VHRFALTAFRQGERSSVGDGALGASDSVKPRMVKGAHAHLGRVRSRALAVKQLKKPRRRVNRSAVGVYSRGADC
jgi:hypothetical protein